MNHWPFFGLRVTTPRLELRYPDDELLAAVVDVAAAGIHDPATMPFDIPWTRQPDGVLQRETLKHFWSTRATLGPDAWRLSFVVVADGEPIGVQDLRAERFPVTRTFETGSWLGRSWQGRGIGTEMRAAVLHLGFAGLGADRATTGCWDDNPASEAVTRSLGYTENGWQFGDREAHQVRSLRFALTRADWLSRRRDDVEITGLEACLPLLGLG